MKKLLLIALITFSLSACSTTKFIHVPVGCSGQPKISLQFTQDEADAMTQAALKKLSVFVKTLRLRIDTQCEINAAHDKQYESEK